MGCSGKLEAEARGGEGAPGSGRSPLAPSRAPPDPSAT